MSGEYADSSDEELKFGEASDDLYDSEADSDDELWVIENMVPGHETLAKDIRERHKKRKESNTDSKKDDVDDSIHRPFDTDAVLSCPLCFATLCIQCQRHDVYKTQFRAVFVQNCQVLEELKPSDNSEDIYRKVVCRTCRTEVAVMDQDEIFHFFAAIPSH